MYYNGIISLGIVEILKCYVPNENSSHKTLIYQAVNVSWLELIIKIYQH